MTDFLLQDYLNNTTEKFENKIAIKYENKKVTYKELKEASIRISDTLIEMGLAFREAVAIYLDKSHNTIAAMFGVVYATGVYIPLDSCYSPVIRTLSIMEQSKVRYLITSGENLERLVKEIHGNKELLKLINVLLIDDKYSLDKDIFNKYVEFNFNKQIKELYKERGKNISDDLAYILYTSGSTGIPKGVMITHINARTFIEWCCSYFKPSHEDKFLSIAPFHFDLSIFDIFVSIAKGGTLVILPTEKSKNPLNLIEVIKKEEITYIYSVPSLWVAIIKYSKLKKGELTSLKKILFAGEVFQPEYLKKTMEILPDALFYNLYGLIETNVCTYYFVKDKECVKDCPVPIGFPCDNTEVVVLNSEGKLASKGEQGELCVRGTIVMKGYYRNEGLTEKSFKVSPIPEHNGERIYCTGDIVVINDEGALEFIGREDSLVKRAGFRIELLEIERILYKDEHIEDVAVVDIKDEEGNTLICAAVKIHGDKMISIIKLKQFIGSILPKYMIPDIIKVIEELPKGANEKINRQDLKKIFRSNI
ncbi:amino acid adenylation domain-containing protein [Clostridium estertheticum]|uniref:amino acid adenylation domain-containing protein n=1 Tax=Clostridium estertheticum TaxID=238834 RepID=UPI0013EE54A1|nr:amino acid adenylation domain-containing protein [Clostridium estertheticum]MBZ9609065.1 amino acid adenylation domain-containing protein [Clostridium estertheticum]